MAISQSARSRLHNTGADSTAKKRGSQTPRLLRQMRRHIEDDAKERTKMGPMKDIYVQTLKIKP